MKNKYPKVLFISHNAFSETHNNGKTYSSFFEGWPKENLAQLYFQNEIPNFRVCDNYHLISDEQMIFSKKKDVGKKILNTNKSEVKKSHSFIHSLVRKKKFPIFILFRDYLWESRKWDNKRLDSWIKSFAPEVIFFVGGNNLFSYKIAKEISERYNLPIVLYYTDDYIMQGWGNGPVNDYLQFRLRHYLDTFLKRVEKVFVIGEEMKKEYEPFLKKECIPIMNAIDLDQYSNVHKSKEFTKEVIKLAYFGGIHLNRWKSLSHLKSVIEKIFREKNIQFTISVYTNERPINEIYDQLNLPPYIQYKGSVRQEEIIEEMSKYDVLIHAESFDKEMRRQTRLSLSTKIPEYLATGKAILAIGPNDVASIKYLNKNNAAFIISDLEKSEEVLLDIYSNRNDLIKKFKGNPILASNNHSKTTQRQRILRVLKEIGTDN